MLQTVLGSAQRTTDGGNSIDGVLDDVNGVLSALLGADADLVETQSLGVDVADVDLQLVVGIGGVADLEHQALARSALTQGQADTIARINPIISNCFCYSIRNIQSGDFGNLLDILGKVAVGGICTKSRLSAGSHGSASIGLQTTPAANQDGNVRGNIHSSLDEQVTISSTILGTQIFGQQEELMAVDGEQRIIKIGSIKLGNIISLEFTAFVQRLGINLYTHAGNAAPDTAQLIFIVECNDLRGSGANFLGLKGDLTGSSSNVVGLADISLSQLLGESAVQISDCNGKARSPACITNVVCGSILCFQPSLLVLVVHNEVQLNGSRSAVLQRNSILEGVSVLTGCHLCVRSRGSILALGALGFHSGQARADDIDLGGSDLLRQGTVQQLDAVEVGAVGDTVDFGTELVNLGLEVLTVNSVLIGAVGRLGGQAHHTVEHVLNFLHRALGGLHQGDAVLDVLAGGIQAGDLGAHLLGNGQTGGVVACAVDLVAGGQLLQVLRDGAGVDVVVAIGVHRRNIMLNSHFDLLNNRRVRYPCGSPMNCRASRLRHPAGLPGTLGAGTGPLRPALTVRDQTWRLGMDSCPPFCLHPYNRRRNTKNKGLYRKFC